MYDPEKITLHPTMSRCGRTCRVSGVVVDEAEVGEAGVG